MAAATLNRPDVVGITGFEEDDRTSMRWALAIALLLHAVLFTLQLPALSAPPTHEERQREYVPINDRFAPPPPVEQQLFPERRVKRVPIPDPTPDGPEIVRRREKIETPLSFAGSDALYGFPDAPPPIESEAPLRVGGEVLPPVRIYSPPPRYPELARRARIQGTVIVEAIIDEHGRVTRTEILKSAPLGLDAAAVEAVSSWRFEPATLRGRPVEVLYTLTVRFELN